MAAILALAIFAIGLWAIVMVMGEAFAIAIGVILIVLAAALTFAGAIGYALAFVAVGAILFWIGLA